MDDHSLVEVVAIRDGFWNGTERREGTVFRVPSIHAHGSWFRPVAPVTSIPEPTRQEDNVRKRAPRRKAADDDQDDILG